MALGTPCHCHCQPGPSLRPFPAPWGHPSPVSMGNAGAALPRPYLSQRPAWEQPLSGRDASVPSPALSPCPKGGAVPSHRGQSPSLRLGREEPSVPGSSELREAPAEGATIQGAGTGLGAARGQHGASVTASCPVGQDRGQSPGTGFSVNHGDPGAPGAAQWESARAALNSKNKTKQNE